jgi:hypothetical protein
MSLKKSNDTIGNRTLDLPACIPVPQPTAPPRTPYDVKTAANFSKKINVFQSIAVFLFLKY